MRLLLDTHASSGTSPTIRNFHGGQAAGSDAIVTHNVKDFRGVETFGIRILTPKQFLQELRDR